MSAESPLQKIADQLYLAAQVDEKKLFESKILKGHLFTAITMSNALADFNSQCDTIAGEFPHEEYDISAIIDAFKEEAGKYLFAEDGDLETRKQEFQLLSGLVGIEDDGMRQDLYKAIQQDNAEALMSITTGQARRNDIREKIEAFQTLAGKMLFDGEGNKKEDLKMDLAAIAGSVKTNWKKPKLKAMSAAKSSERAGPPNLDDAPIIVGTVPKVDTLGAHRNAATPPAHPHKAALHAELAATIGAGRGTSDAGVDGVAKPVTAAPELAAAEVQAPDFVFADLDMMKKYIFTQYIVTAKDFIKQNPESKNLPLEQIIEQVEAKDHAQFLKEKNILLNQSKAELKKQKKGSDVRSLKTTEEELTEKLHSKSADGKALYSPEQIRKAKEMMEEYRSDLETQLGTIETISESVKQRLTFEFVKNIYFAPPGMNNAALSRKLNTLTEQIDLKLPKDFNLRYYEETAQEAASVFMEKYGTNEEAYNSANINSILQEAVHNVQAQEIINVVQKRFDSEMHRGRQKKWAMLKPGIVDALEKGIDQDIIRQYVEQKLGEHKRAITSTYMGEDKAPKSMTVSSAYLDKLSSKLGEKLPQIAATYKAFEQSLDNLDQARKQEMWNTKLLGSVITPTLDESLLEAAKLAGADVSAKGLDGKTPLHLAVENNHTEAIKVLLADEKIDPTIKDKDGKTPLDLAKEADKAEIVKLLEAKEAEIAATVSLTKGTTIEDTLAAEIGVLEANIQSVGDVIAALQSPASSDHALAVAGIPATSSSTDPPSLKEIEQEVFLQYDTEDKHALEERTALHIAVLNQNLDLVNALIRAKATPNTQDINGHTPLHIAASKGDEKSLEALLAAGADSSIKDSNQHTALDIAKMMQQSNIVDLFQKKEVELQKHKTERLKVLEGLIKDKRFDELADLPEATLNLFEISGEAREAINQAKEARFQEKYAKSEKPKGPSTAIGGNTKFYEGSGQFSDGTDKSKEDPKVRRFHVDLKHGIAPLRVVEENIPPAQKTEWQKLDEKGVSLDHERSQVKKVAQYSRSRLRTRLQKETKEVSKFANDLIKKSEGLEEEKKLVRRAGREDYQVKEVAERKITTITDDEGNAKEFYRNQRVFMWRYKKGKNGFEKIPTEGKDGKNGYQVDWIEFDKDGKVKGGFVGHPQENSSLADDLITAIIEKNVEKYEALKKMKEQAAKVGATLAGAVSHITVGERERSNALGSKDLEAIKEQFRGISGASTTVTVGNDGKPLPHPPAAFLEPDTDLGSNRGTHFNSENLKNQIATLPNRDRALSLDSAAREEAKKAAAGIDASVQSRERSASVPTKSKEQVNAEAKEVAELAQAAAKADAAKAADRPRSASVGGKPLRGSNGINGPNSSSNI